jgi:tetratricopeptide (TPR) repeat protein
MMRSVLVCLCAAMLAACTSAPPIQAWRGPAPEELVAEIRAAGASAPGELDVQPLRDPMVEDLRAQAVRWEQQQRYVEAAAALDKALGITPNDPALLQERAEVAVLQKDLDKAGMLARNAYALGAKVGPLCRRHWATIRQQLAHRQRQLDAQAIDKQLKGETLAQWERALSEVERALGEAQRGQSDCTLTGPPRY